MEQVGKSRWWNTCGATGGGASGDGINVGLQVVSPHVGLQAVGQVGLHGVGHNHTW